MSRVKALVAKMTPLQRLLVGAIILALFGLACYQSVYMPQSNMLRAETGNKVKSKPALVKMKAEVNKLENRSGGPVAPDDGQREKLAAQGNELFTRATRNEFIKKLPKLGADSGLKGFKPVENQASSGVVVLKIDSSGGGKDDVLVYRHAVDITCTARFADLSRFLQRLKQENRYIRLASLKVDSINYTANLDVKMTIYLYYEEGT